MTEVHVVSYTPHNETVYASLGIPIPGVVCKIVCVDTGKSLGPNQTGELCVKSPGSNPGYYKNQRATDELIDHEGWYHTGDLVYYDEKSYIYYVNRLKDIIKFNGMQISPCELEMVLMNHKDVSDAVVFGIPHAKYGEVPTAFVVLKPNAKTSESQLVTYVAGHVAHFKRLRGGVQFLSEIPRSPAGKIARSRLKLLLQNSQL